jgi:hypothetical protein
MTPDAAAAATFFFAIYGKSFVHTFNYSIRNTSKCQTSHLLIHLCLQAWEDPAMHEGGGTGYDTAP